MKISGIDTPALIVDAKVFYKNMEAMKKVLSGSGLSLRPHYKSHKCAAIAKMQIAGGAIGMTCAKLSEAIDLCDCGVEDILIANQITDSAKIRRLALLALNCRLTVCVDDESNIAELNSAASDCGATIHCLIEYEIGMQRCGVDSDEEVGRLARLISDSSNLVYDGIQAYAGHISHVEDEDERREMTEANFEKLRSLIFYLDGLGLHPNTVSGGSTGTCKIKAAAGIYTELQAGSYLFMDATYKNLGLPFENSLFLLAGVVSAKPGLVVVDAGVKTCGVDQGMPAVVGAEIDEVVASEEHFQLHGGNLKANVGDRLMLIPAHCCSTVNLHDKIYLVEDGRVIDRIFVSARGCGK